MPSGPGFWLDPSNSVLHKVTTHNDWMIVTNNQKQIGLGPTEVSVLDNLDPVKEIDEIRMVGVMSGLIRIRDYGNRVSVQFHASPSEVNAVLRAVVKAIPGVTNDRFPFLTLQNLSDDTVALIHLSELVAKLNAGEPVLIPREKPIPENEELRQRMDLLMADAAD